MYLHLSRNLSIHAGDVVAIVNLTGRQGRSVCQHCGLPLILRYNKVLDCLNESLKLQETGVENLYVERQS